MDNAKIFVLGSINVDLVVYAERFPEAGETIVGKEFLINQGGKGANQAVAAKKASGNVTFIGRVGSDIFSTIAINSLRKFNVENHLIIDEHTETGIAVINVDDKGENRITIIEGANGKVGSEELKYLKSNIKVGDFLLLQGEIHVDVLVEASQIAKSSNATVIFDPAPVKNELTKVIPFADFITPNENELRKLTNSNDPYELLKLGAKNIVFKMGERGVRFINESEDFVVPAFKVDVVDTTGAGDTFNGSFVAALSKGMSIKDALRFGNAAAAISVTRKGAAISSPTYDEIVKFLEVHCEL
ncbi:ribokinase [Caldisericum exile]|uniref:Ribokinase n=1 Tax=Caldisericum exile (strain DSM 21853 / NBRC 104410 / AZM16c01) TaxID=511051 RepID=A0A7U6GFT8_CALEA|nr:ribokinase [Caldisericum exile]BAL81537.1 ribokinase [Caldisericum exile AZM16c01]